MTRVRRPGKANRVSVSSDIKTYNEALISGEEIKEFNPL